MKRTKLNYKDLKKRIEKGLFCPKCGSIFSVRNGHLFYNYGKIQAYLCLDCGKSFSKRTIEIQRQKFKLEAEKHGLNIDVEKLWEHDIQKALEDLKAMKPLTDKKGNFYYIGKKSKTAKQLKEYWKTHGKKTERFEETFRTKGKLGKRFVERLTK